MKTYYSLLLTSLLSFSGYSQIMDTCEWVDQNNNIGGLDCYMGSLGSFFGGSYQWLNCDENYDAFLDDTLEYTISQIAGNVALEVTYAGCIDTSECNYHCLWGLEELNKSNLKRIKIIDLMGRETRDLPNIPVIYIYEDGTTKKVYRIED